MNIPCIQENDPSFSEALELLVEIRLASDFCSQSSLFQFAGLLSELITLRQNQDQRVDKLDLTALTEFISDGLREVRSMVSGEKLCIEHMDSLCDQAIDTWGELLAGLQDVSATPSEQRWEFSTELPGDLETVGTETDDAAEPEVPSRDEIQALLNQLAPSTQETEPAQIVANPGRQDDTRSTRHDTEAAIAQAIETDSIEDLLTLVPELREAFMDDASSCLGSIENALLRLESNPHDQKSLNEILRELHTLKGASGSVGFTALADQIHQLEETLREDETAGRAPTIESLLRNVDQIRIQINGIDSGQNSETRPDPACQVMVETVKRPTATPVLSDESADDDLVRVKSSQLNRLMDMLAELVMLRNQRETELSELQEVYHELINSVSKMRLLSNESDFRPESSKTLQFSEVASDILESAQHLRDCTRPFADGNAAVSRFIRQFRQELVELRRTPISGLFRRLQRVVRDAARAECKYVRLAMVGEDAGIERALQQRLYEPLLHIVRNSVCHGIELPQERQQVGKDREGVVSLEAKSGPDLFVIEVRDDGRGLDYEAIRRRGVERGLLSTDQMVNREDLSQLIFHPGFSTRETVSQVGGRGVGMDVVAATMQRMRGWIEVESESGTGTRIRLSFPLPSVVQHAMVFRSAGQLFALPMESVQSAGGVAVEIRQHNFSQLLGLDPGDSQESLQAIVVAGSQQVSDNSKAAPLALMVDEILGPEELVIRPLPSLLKNHPFCVGASLSGMGQTVILLDARRVLQTQKPQPAKVKLSSEPGRSCTSRNPSLQSTKARTSQPPLTRPRVLVVDDSITARKRVVRSLSRYSIETVEATDGKEALELLKKMKFAAVFSDLEMPNVDGIELLVELNSPDRSDPPPVVIVSSRSEKESTDRARQLGAASYLIKPLTNETLDAALRRVKTLRHLVSNSNSIQSRTNR